MARKGRRGRAHGENRACLEVLAGRNSVREALLAGRRRIDSLFVAEGASDRGVLGEILDLCDSRGIPVRRVPRADLYGLAETVEHQGVVAQVSPYPYSQVSDILEVVRARNEPALLLALDSLQDPQNLGALIRTAEAVGVHGVLVPSRRTAKATTAVSRASAGAMEHLNVALVTNLVRALETLKAEGLWVVGVANDPSAQDYRQVDMSMPVVVVVGSEGQGMRRLVREACDELVRLPMRGQVTSLNVAVAGSVVLYRAAGSRESPVE